MGKSVVWASNAMINPAMLRPITHSFNNDAQIQFAIESKYKNYAGEILGPDRFPPEIFVSKGAKTNYETLPELFYAGSYWIVSGEVAAIMRQFDTGGAGFYPTRVLRKDRQTPIGDTWCCLNFGNVKKAYLSGGHDHSPSIQKAEVWHAPPMVLHDNALSLSANALIGPDIWVDPQIRDIFFVSDRLAGALKKAGLARAFGFKKCGIID